MKLARSTSIEAYKKIQAEGLLSKLRFQVYDVLFNRGPLTQGETWKEHFGSSQRHTICPRFAELESLGVVQCVGERPCRVTGRVTRLYDVTDQLPSDFKPKITNAQRVQILRRICQDAAQVFRAQGFDEVASEIESQIDL
jgi:hypothetical protein